MAELSKLREQREDYVNEMKALADVAEKEGRSFTDEELVRYDTCDNEQTKIKAQIETLERADRLRGLLGGTKENPNSSPVIKIKRAANYKDYNDSFKAWALSGVSELRRHVADDWKRSADLIGVDLNEPNWICRTDPTTQSTDVPTEGKETINDSVYRGFWEAKKAYGGMLEASNVFSVASAETMHFATDDDTASVAQKHAQNAPVTEKAVVVNKVSLTPELYSSGIGKVSVQMLRDSRMDVGAWVGRKLTRRLLAKINADLTTALYAGDVSKTAAFSFNINEFDLEDLYFSLDAAYRNSPKTKWMMNDSTLAQLIKVLKDTIGQPIWGNGLRDSPERSILDKGIVNNTDMHSMQQATLRYPIIFGDFEAMHVATVGNAPNFHRLNELYMDTLSVGFVAYWEVGGVVVKDVAADAPLVSLSTGTLSGDPAEPFGPSIGGG